ncbi:CAP domain-containing protein [uncultured Roseovarius sp.]|uniref:CAP domain-containing protein n=1 Tax=Roseovarius sp. TaxID=1486281 RepID=UPI0025F46C38|nr:CAP domain-containing protein [uncultured Roseovarius sp.]
MRGFSQARLIALMLALGGAMSPANAQVADLGQASLDWVNAQRAQSGRGAVVVSPALTRAAAAHAGDMGKKGYFSHTGANGSSIGDRVRRQKYRFCFVTENIAKGQDTLDEVLRDWMASPEHRRNMLHESAVEFGLVRGPGQLWVMVLGRSGC